MADNGVADRQRGGVQMAPVSDSPDEQLEVAKLVLSLHPDLDMVPDRGLLNPVELPGPGAQAFGAGPFDVVEDALFRPALVSSRSRHGSVGEAG